MKFTPEKKPPISGFWASAIGDTLTGRLEAHVAPSASRSKPFYVFAIETIEGQVRTPNGLPISCVAGSRVGVSSFTNLRGLHKYVGQRMRIRHVANEPVGSGRTMKVFDVEIFDEDGSTDGDEVADASVSDGEAPEDAPF